MQSYSACKKIFLSFIKFMQFSYIAIDKILFTSIITPTKRSMLNIWLNIKYNSSRKRTKNPGCHATDYAFLRLWYRFEVRKLSRFVRFTFHVKKVYQNLTGNCVYRSKSTYDLMRILSELVFIPQMQEFIGCCMTFPDF